MGVDLCRLEIRMAEHRLHRAQIRPALEQVRGKGVAEHMGRVFGYAIMMSPMISSRVISLLYAARGFRVECE